MKPTTLSNRFSTLLRAGSALAAVAIVLAAQATGCDVGNEGERCNPLLSHDECGSGLSCQQPSDCPETYCCPTSGTSANPYCQPGCAGGFAAICAANPSADSDCGAADATPASDSGQSDGPTETATAADAGTDG